MKRRNQTVGINDRLISYFAGTVITTSLEGLRLPACQQIAYPERTPFIDAGGAQHSAIPHLLLTPRQTAVVRSLALPNKANDGLREPKRTNVKSFAEPGRLCARKACLTTLFSFWKDGFRGGCEYTLSALPAERRLIFLVLCCIYARPFRDRNTASSTTYGMYWLYQRKIVSGCDFSL